MLKDSKNTYSYNKVAILAIGCWVLINLVQAIVTPIHVDEAYYWMYSQYLDWGYFDHPPAVAVFIWLSDVLFNGTLGVRFFTVLSQLFTFLLIYKTVTKEEQYENSFLLKFFLAFILLPLNHIFGFITTPDVPLMLSTALFFYALKGVVERKDYISYIIWTIAMSMMLYSKYHSGLVILIVLIAVPALFKNWKTYASGFLALCGFIPHFLWQYDHNWVSFAYHLSERVEVFSWTFPFEYLGNVLVVFNPFLIFFFIKLVLKKWKGEYERACYFVVIGFVLFFLWQSFRVRVQPQWLIVIYIPGLYLMRDEISKIDVKKVVKFFLWVLPLFILLRVFMVWDILPVKFNIHGMKEYVEEIQEDANGRDVMFFGSYKRASIYSWYSDQDYTHSYNGSISRKNQYNIWELDSIYHGEEVYFVGVYSPGRESTYYEKGNYYGNVIDYEPNDKIRIEVLKSEIVGDSLHSEIKINHEYGDAIKYEDKHYLALRYFKDGKYTKELYGVKGFEFSREADHVYSVKVSLPKEEGVNGFSYILRHENLPFGPVYTVYEYPVE